MVWEFRLPHLTRSFRLFRIFVVWQLSAFPASSGAHLGSACFLWCSHHVYQRLLWSDDSSMGADSLSSCLGFTMLSLWQPERRQISRHKKGKWQQKFMCVVFFCFVFLKHSSDPDWFCQWRLRLRWPMSENLFWSLDIGVTENASMSLQFNLKPERPQFDHFR